MDANPILSALLGGNARRVFFESGVEEFAVPESVLEEVRAYIPAFSTKTGLPQDVLDFLLELLPLTPYAASTYRRANS